MVLPPYHHTVCTCALSIICTGLGTCDWLKGMSQLTFAHLQLLAYSLPTSLECEAAVVNWGESQTRLGTRPRKRRGMKFSFEYGGTVIWYDMVMAYYVSTYSQKRPPAGAICPLHGAF
jgi:hypothetical protein